MKRKVFGTFLFNILVNFEIFIHQGRPCGLLLRLEFFSCSGKNDFPCFQNITMGLRWQRALLAFCSIKRTVCPLFWISWMISKISWIKIGANPIEGSSRSKSFGVDMRHAPLQAFVVPHQIGLLHLDSSVLPNWETGENFLQVSLVFFSRSFFKKAPISKFSITVKPGKTWRPSGT